MFSNVSKGYKFCDAFFCASFAMIATLIHLLASSPDAMAKDFGLGVVGTSIPSGFAQPPTPRYMDAQYQGKPPTNQWYSSIIFDQWSNVLHAHPLTIRATKKGVEIGKPEAIETGSVGPNKDVRFPHRAAIRVSAGVDDITGAGDGAYLTKSSDWGVGFDWRRGSDFISTNIAHGSPMVHMTVGGNLAQLKLGIRAKYLPDLSIAGRLAYEVYGNIFLVYVPKEAVVAQQKRVVTITIPGASPSEGFDVMVGALPGKQMTDVHELLELFDSAYVDGPHDTKVAWSFDEETSLVTTSYKFVSARKTSALVALYPHHWHDNMLLRHERLLGEYTSIRGPLKLYKLNEFRTQHAFQGIFPFVPVPQGKDELQLVKALWDEDMQQRESLTTAVSSGTYWQGKSLGRIGQLLGLATQLGDAQQQKDIQNQLANRLSDAFAQKDNRQFIYDETIGSLLGYPNEFGSVTQMNDHHFHYGYWIFAAAQIALRDPEWARHENWGGMVRELIKDVATADRNDERYPFLRTFDIFEGHSWASGTGQTADGSNQESSSEAMNAWAGLILWGVATQDDALRDLGIYLYTTELQAIKHYWFDVYNMTRPAQYPHRIVSIVWGGKLSHITWWTESPVEISMINVLPVTGASYYLRTNPDAMHEVIKEMDEDFVRFRNGSGYATPRDIWQDIVVSYVALYDAKGALKRWDSNAAVELGATKSHTGSWVYHLNEDGHPVTNVTANDVFSKVFEKDGKRLALIFNHTEGQKTVKFSTGEKVVVEGYGFHRASLRPGQH